MLTPHSLVHRKEALKMSVRGIYSEETIFDMDTTMNVFMNIS